MIRSITPLLNLVLRKLHNPTVHVFLIRMLGAFIAYVSQLIIARWLNPSDNGIYIQYMSVLAILVPLLTIGFETSPQFFINQYIEKKEFSKILGFMHSAKIISVIISIVFIGMSYLFGIYFEIGNDALKALLLIGCIGIPWALIEIQGGIARCWGWMWLAIAPSYLFRFLVLAAVCVIYIFSHKNSSYVEALQLTLLSTSLVCIVQYALLKKALKKVIPETKKNDYQNNVWIKYGMPVAISNILYIAISFSDVLIIGQLFTAQDVAIYYIASKTIIISTFIMYAIGVSSSQIFSQHIAKNDSVALQNSVTNATRNSLFFTLITSTFLIVFGYWILYLFGQVYLEGYPYIVLLSFVPVIRATIGPADRLMIMAKAEKNLAHNIFTVLFITIFCQLIGALVLGVIGVAIGTIIACCIETYIMRNSAKKVLNIECFYFLQKKIEIYSTHENLSFVNIKTYNNIFFDSRYLRPFNQYSCKVKDNIFILSIDNKNTQKTLGEIPLGLKKILGFTAIYSAFHKNAVLGTPIIKQEEGYNFCFALLDSLKKHYNCSIFSAFYLNNTNFINDFKSGIEITKYNILYEKKYNRAILDFSTAQNADEYLKNSISTGRLKEYRRLYKRLSDLGDIKFLIHTQESDLLNALENYIALECSGWKGGNLKNKSQQDRYFLKSFISALAKDNKVHIVEMRLDDMLVASGIVIVNQDVAYYYKTSFNEVYKQFSPGVLLTLQLTKYLFTIQGLKYVDSCAIENHTMINKIWRQRQEMLDIIITPHARYSPTWCIATVYVAIAIHGRAQLKAVYLKLFKR